jgi:type I restriction enzyme S subunit
LPTAISVAEYQLLLPKDELQTLVLNELKSTKKRMSEVNKLIPELRFPEFKDEKEWEIKTLGEVTDRIEEKVNDKKVITASISARTGFVSQAEKFSRDISGAQYKNYIVLKEGEYSYNKGNSKKFPQGCIYKLKEFKQVAVPNAFISFRFRENFVGDFYQGYFDNNYHGLQLQQFITSGARMDGLLNIKASDFFSITLPTPSILEQQKIASCLSSLDEIITAHIQKLELLKEHKKSLMQNLFPQEGETVPKYRFPEFTNDGEWVETKLGEISKITSGGTPNRSNNNFWNGNIPWISTTLIDFNIINEANEYITESGLQNSSAKIFQKNTILMAMYGQGKTRGKVAILGIEAATNQACAAIILRKNYNTEFVFQYLAASYDEIRRMSNSGGQENLSGGLIEIIPIPLPQNPLEQQKIASCLSSLDKLITAQAEKVEQLKRHKKGLMQGLFPKMNE